MLDLQPIKDRLEMASPDKGRRVGYPPDADLKNHAYEDLAALVAEVERLENEAAVMQQVTLAGLVAEVSRLQNAIKTHKQRCERTFTHNVEWDKELWKTLA